MSGFLLGEEESFSVGIYKSIARMILAQKSSPVPSSRRSSLAPLPRRGCLVLPVPRRSPEPSPAPRSRAEPPPALGRIEQRDLIHRLSIETKFQFQFKRESRVQVPQLILKIQNQPATGVLTFIGFVEMSHQSRGNRRNISQE